MVIMKQMPRISIITPSFNQGQFIEDTILSVINQNYPSLEYIIIDGGSTDNSIDIIRKYEKQLRYWVSEPDNGQSDAINKGAAFATGDLIAWINSDDLYLPDTFQVVAQAFSHRHNQLIVGPVINFREGDHYEQLMAQTSLTDLESMVRFWTPGWSWHQPGIFIPRSSWMENGGLNISYHYGMDYDLVLKLLQSLEPKNVSVPLARFRLHGKSKGGKAGFELFLYEWSQISKRYWSEVGIEKSDEHDRYISRQLALLIGSRLRKFDLKLASRAFEYALKMKLSTQVLGMLIVESFGWFKEKNLRL
jgi:glycosyltransferase involved in cell wall biosynthesis